MHVKVRTVAFATMAILSSGVLAGSDTCTMISREQSSIAQYSGSRNKEFKDETGAYW